MIINGRRLPEKHTHAVVFAIVILSFYPENKRCRDVFDKLWLIVEIFSPAYSNPPAQDHTLKTDIQEMSTVGCTLPDQGQDKHTDSAAPRHTSHPCSSPTICTPTCPTTYWTQDQGTSPRLEQFRQAGTNPSTSLAQLVAGILTMARWKTGARETLRSMSMQSSLTRERTGGGLSGKLPGSCLDRSISLNDFSALFTELICPFLKSETNIVTQHPELLHSSKLSENYHLGRPAVLTEPGTHSLISDISTVFLKIIKHFTVR